MDYKKAFNVLMGGGNFEDENAELRKMIEELKKQNEEKDKIIQDKDKYIQKIEVELDKPLKGKNEINTYNEKNLRLFLKSLNDNDKILTNPEIYEFTEGETAYEKNIKANPTYFRKYQEDFIKDWSISTQELVILYYGVGSGKTTIAVNCGEQFLELNNNSYVYFLVPASLVFNTIKEMYMRGIDPNRKNEKGEYVYYFVSYQQLLRSKFDFKDNSLLILDEAHNLRNIKTKENLEKISSMKYKSTGNFSLVGNKLAQLLIENSDKFVRSIFMTGTLFINGPEDLDGIVAIGYKKEPFLKMEYQKWNSLLNDEKAFKHYFEGLIAFYRISPDNPSFPRVKYHFVGIKSEEKKIRYSFGEDAYFTKSRREDAPQKLKWLVEFLNKNRLQKNLIYSQFLADNIIAFKDKLIEMGLPNVYVISGKQSKQEKLRIVEEFNEKKIGTLLFTLAIKEGISFSEVKNIIITEPYWNYAILEQVIARGIRLTSHKAGNKSLVNVYFPIVYEKDIGPLTEKTTLKFLKYAEDAFNNGIKNFKAPFSKNRGMDLLKDIREYKTEIIKSSEFINLSKNDDDIRRKKDKEIMMRILQEQYSDGKIIDEDTFEKKTAISGVSRSRDIDILMKILEKQSTINDFEKKLLALPKFEDVNNNENNPFIKFYNAYVLELENEQKRQLSNKEMLSLKKSLYKEFYEKALKEKDKLLNRMRIKDNPAFLKRSDDEDPSELSDKLKFEDKTEELRELIYDEKPLDDMLSIYGIDKLQISKLQANFTPQNFCDYLIEYLDIKNDKRDDLKILEPTAGIGNFIPSLMNLPNRYNFMIDCNEIYYPFFEIGKTIYEDINNIYWYNLDFYNSYVSKYNYDYIIGNPPFNLKTKVFITNKKGDSQYQDVNLFDMDFVALAYNMLNDNGKLGMIISNKITWQKTGIFKDYSEILEDMKKIQPGSVEIIDINKETDLKSEFKKSKGVSKTMETKVNMVMIFLTKIPNHEINARDFKLNKNIKIELSEETLSKKSKDKEKRDEKKKLKSELGEKDEKVNIEEPIEPEFIVFDDVEDDVEEKRKAVIERHKKIKPISEYIVEVKNPKFEPIVKSLTQSLDLKKMELKELNEKREKVKIQRNIIREKLKKEDTKELREKLKKLNEKLDTITDEQYDLEDSIEENEDYIKLYKNKTEDPKPPPSRRTEPEPEPEFKRRVIRDEPIKEEPKPEPKKLSEREKLEKVIDDIEEKIEKTIKKRNPIYERRKEAENEYEKNEKIIKSSRKIKKEDKQDMISAEYKRYQDVLDETRDEFKRLGDELEKLRRDKKDAEDDLSDYDKKLFSGTKKKKINLSDLF